VRRQAAALQKAVHLLHHSIGLLDYGLRHLPQRLGVGPAGHIFVQQLGIALHGGEGRLEFVGGNGEELVLRRLDGLQPADVHCHDDHPLDLTLKQNGSRACLCVALPPGARIPEADLLLQHLLAGQRPAGDRPDVGTI
jgi:hypothetical protein